MGLEPSSRPCWLMDAGGDTDGRIEPLIGGPGAEWVEGVDLSNSGRAEFVSSSWEDELESDARNRSRFRGRVVMTV